MNIIVYPPGSGGNLVSAVIDNTNYRYTGVHFETNRNRLRTRSYMELMSDQDRDNYISKLSLIALSLPSHTLEYHIDRKHDFILIAPITDIEINWCIERFSKIHTENAHLVTNIEGYRDFVQKGLAHTTKVISVEDIYSGRLLERLKEYITTPLNEQLYCTWLESDTNKKP